jgi:hypothetical protein
VRRADHSSRVILSVCMCVCVCVCGDLETSTMGGLCSTSAVEPQKKKAKEEHGRSL